MAMKAFTYIKTQDINADYFSNKTAWSPYSHLVVGFIKIWMNDF